MLALWVDLSKPYWAVGTVYITSQVLAGATRSKAVYRVCGTVIVAIVSDTLRVEGYFKETKLPRIRVGDRARIRLMGGPPR